MDVPLIRLLLNPILTPKITLLICPNGNFELNSFRHAIGDMRLGYGLGLQ